MVEAPLANPFHEDKLWLPQHRSRVEALAAKEMIPPQTIEVDLTDGACNQACLHCCFSSGEGRQLTRIDSEVLLGALHEAYDMGTRAVELVGGGEPTVHPKVAEIIERISEIGNHDMAVGIITNGLLAERLLSVSDHLAFIRISLDTANVDTYMKLHGVPPRQFEKVINNVRRLRDVIPHTPLARRLGLGYLVVPPYNHQTDEITEGAKLADELDVDYIVYRPAEIAEPQPQEFWQEAQSAIFTARQELKDMDSHTAVFGGTGNRWDTLKPNSHPSGTCAAQPLVAVLRADGGIAGCILDRNKPDRDIGNIYTGSFKEQWYSDTHKQAWLERDIQGCPNPCKMNRYGNIVIQFASGKETPISSREVDHPAFV